jgi:hypothetical protein
MACLEMLEVEQQFPFHSEPFCFEFCYGVYNQYESFIYLDLIVKNREVSIER